MKNFLKLGTSAVLGSMAVLCASHAFAVPLSSLDTSPTASLTAGNATFNNFVYSNPGGYGPSDSAIDVSTLSGASAGGSGNVGVRFSASWDSSNGATDTVISYRVHANQAVSNVGISGVYLSFDGSATNTAGGNAFAEVAETVQDANTGRMLGTFQVYNGNLTTGIANNQTNTLDLGGSYTDLILTKDIMVTATPGGSATINMVDNGFTGNNLTGSPPPVPEPMSLALIPLGLIGLGLRKKLARA